MTKKEFLARSIAQLSKHAFTELVVEIFSGDSNYEHIEPLTEVAEDAFFQPLIDSYGGSIHSAVLLHFPPLELFRPSKPLTIKDPYLIERLKRVKKAYRGKSGQWGMVSPHLRQGRALNSIKFVTNLFGIKRKTYEGMLIPAYRELMDSCGLKKTGLFLGSCDSFADLDFDGAQTALDKIKSTHREGVAISISSERIAVRDFSSQRVLAAGLSAGTRSAYEPILVSQTVNRRTLLCQFEELINKNVSEVQLEKFIAAHFQEIFGMKYDLIVRQLWLRFPDLDISGKNRRCDLFVRNSVRNDWELFEVKRPIPLERSYRDIPVVSRELHDSLLQIRNYANMLSQDKVKRYLAAEGIEYYEPVMNLVIGRKPQISRNQWKWLEAELGQKAQIFTFDDLLSEMKQRFDEWHINAERELALGVPNKRTRQKQQT